MHGDGCSNHAYDLYLRLSSQAHLSLNIESLLSVMYSCSLWQHGQVSVASAVEDLPRCAVPEFSRVPGGNL